MTRRTEKKIRGRMGVGAVALASLLTGIYIATAHAARTAKLIGVVLPKDVRRGERASGSIVLYPGAIKGVSGLQVEKLRVDLDDDQPRKAVLRGIVVDGGVQKRPAEQNFLVDVPANAKSVHLVLSRDDQQIGVVDVPLEESTAQPLTCGSGDWISGTEQDGSKSQFRTPATYCYAGMAVIAGTFSGDGEQTEIDAGGRRARVVGESVRYCYFLLPSTIMPGHNKITLHEGTHVVAFDVLVPRLDLMQMLEESGPGVADASPPSGSAESSDSSSSALPLGIGIGVGSMGIGGGSDEGPSVGWGRRRD